MAHGYAGDSSSAWGSPSTQSDSPLQLTLDLAHRVAGGIGAHLRQAILGRDDVIELVLIALLADGHVLLEDYPGSGKTTLAKALGRAISSEQSQYHLFRRIQFTPDLLPSDVTGVSIFHPQQGSFSFNPGPIFCHILLADEVNRTPPKVQAAMLEAMGEKQVTADGRLYPLDDLFFVIATQNPLDTTGTYPLPSPQLDRFLFKIPMNHISQEAEMEVLDKALRDAQRQIPRMHPITRDEILRCRQNIRAHIEVSPLVREALVEMANEIRNDQRVLQGISTRSLVLALSALQARAAIRGRDYVHAEDLQKLSPFLFCHRLELAPGSPDPQRILRELMISP
ncbi:MAG: AAA family ATPase, partial [Myxococcota bacterium]